jgi:hypothetical protein
VAFNPTGRLKRQCSRQKTNSALFLLIDGDLLPQLN